MVEVSRVVSPLMKFYKNTEVVDNARHINKITANLANTCR